MHHRYTKRRAGDSFRAHAAVTDAGKQQALWEQANKDLEVVKRQALVYSLYGRKQRSVMVRAQVQLCFKNGSMSLQGDGGGDWLLAAVQDVPLVQVLEKQAASTASD